MKAISAGYEPYSTVYRGLQTNMLPEANGCVTPGMKIADMDPCQAYPLRASHEFSAVLLS